jgi:cyclopropane-fatty-acyl-phospholipid synthase
MRYALDSLIRRFLVVGSLQVRYPDGHVSHHEGAPGPAVAFTVSDWAAVRRMVLNPGLALGEGYMDGAIAPDGCTIYDALDLLMTNLVQGGRQPVMALHGLLAAALKRWAQFNPAARARRNAAHHYDLNGRLYALLLDADRQYSCAYFPAGNETLDEAQAAKKRLIAAKLLLRPGLRVLDIGCGWGGMALTLAREHGVHVTGITLSEEQLAAARARAVDAGLQDRVRFELLDYRALAGECDRIVSVGMFEHVGVNHYRSFFGVLRRVLAPDGVALLHSIGRSHGSATTNPWLAKYIFPGGYSPALSEVLPAVEASGLYVTDVEVLRLHYAETLRHWRSNLLARHDAVAALYDERFCRMFEFYLAGAELAFRHTGHMVWQMQLAASVDAVPLTRDYLWQPGATVARQPHTVLSP